MVINILMATDDTYVPFLGTCIVSVLSNAGVSDEFVFYIMSFEDELSKVNQQKISNLSTSKKFTVNFVTLEKKRVEGFFDSSHTLNMYLRLFAPEKIQHVDKILYMDCDVIVRQSLADLYAVDLLDNMLAATKDAAAILKDCDVWVYEKSVNPDYFNSGVLVMNLKLMREEGFTTAIHKWLFGRETLKFPDQDALNSLYKERTIITDITWNMQFPLLALAASEDYISADTIANPAIVHFSTPQKPWLYLPEPPFKREFEKYLLRTPWSDYRPYDKTLYNVIKKCCRFLKHNF